MSEDTKVKVVTGKVRFTYLTIVEPKAQEEGKKPKFSTGIIIDGSDEETLAAIRKAVRQVAEANAQAYGGKVPKTIKQPLRDGDEKGDEAYEGNMFFNASSLRKPPVIDAEGNPVDATSIKSGDYGRASVTFYFYNTGTSKGVAAGLNAIQFLEAGEPLGGKGANTGAAADFGVAKNDFGV